MIRLQFYVPHDITRRNEILNCVVIVIMLGNMVPCVCEIWYFWQQKLKSRERNNDRKITKYRRRLSSSRGKFRNWFFDWFMLQQHALNRSARIQFSLQKSDPFSRLTLSVVKHFETFGNCTPVLIRCCSRTPARFCVHDVLTPKNYVLQEGAKSM